MPNGKSPGHDGLTKEFFEHFCENSLLLILWNGLKLMVAFLFLKDKTNSEKR